MNADKHASIHFDRGILVGVDEKPLSEHVVRMGEELSLKLAVPVRRVHAVPRLPDVWPGLNPARGEALTVELLDSARTAVENRIRPILAEFAARAPERGRSATRKPGASA